ncbi:hydroxymethylglutaryl-CoA reductase [Neolewinella aurantiaca]|uniref:hydroxymethylglutaryl-CoA reductase n=1 Tax=Neolewinella aurantiaca TaxID=2602767 RepID=UPI001FE4D553|nr:hydroxymethylglutaryl-CoA reductase [Neolewinella aurantiaca]
MSLLKGDTSLHNLDLPELEGRTALPTGEDLRGNIENYIGMARVPVGLAGPLLISGEEACGEVMVPLATTEGALVASYSRGMKAITSAGGAVVRVLETGVQRAPYFKLEDLPAAGRFVAWVLAHLEDFADITSKTSRYARFKKVKPILEGNSVTLVFEFFTGDAAGQNMVTICTDQICRHVIDACGEVIQEFYIESNASGDKKANHQSFQSVRGRKVSIEVTLPRSVVGKVLKSTPENMERFGRAAAYGSLKTGTLGVQAHCANGLAALFIACGQDAACVAEAAVGIVRMEVDTNGDLYVAGTFPNLIVGSVGGGTRLGTQRECLEIIGCYGAGKANRLAEITAGVCLAGELSILAALAEGHFVQAHASLGRRKD